MNTSTLARRQAWFGVFPHGSVEFLLVTRILMVVLLLGIAAVQAAQRPLLLLAFFVVLSLDYLLVLGWVAQTAADLHELEAFPNASPGTGQRRRRAQLLACLPPIALLILVAPWPEYAFQNLVTRASIMRVLLPLLGAGYCVLSALAFKEFQRLGAGPVVWVLLLFVPVVHWLALHRLLNRFRHRLHAGAMRQDEKSDVEGPSLAIPLADVTWLLFVLPWTLLAAVSLLRTGWIPGGEDLQGLGSLVDSVAIPCAAVLGAVFAVADVAALEGVQRQLITALRRISPGAPA